MNHSQIDYRFPIIFRVEKQLTPARAHVKVYQDREEGLADVTGSVVRHLAAKGYIGEFVGNDHQPAAAHLVVAATDVDGLARQLKIILGACASSVGQTLPAIRPSTALELVGGTLSGGDVGAVSARHQGVASPEDDTVGGLMGWVVRYVKDRFPNNPIMHWSEGRRGPQDIDPAAAMPRPGSNPGDLSHIACFVRRGDHGCPSVEVGALLRDGQFKSLAIGQGDAGSDAQCWEIARTISDALEGVLFRNETEAAQESELEKRLHQALKDAWPYVNKPFVSNTAKAEVGRFANAPSVAGQRIQMVFALQTAWTFVHGSDNEPLKAQLRAFLGTGRTAWAEFDAQRCADYFVRCEESSLGVLRGLCDAQVEYDHDRGGVVATLTPTEKKHLEAFPADFKIEPAGSGSEVSCCLADLQTTSGPSEPSFEP